MSEELEIREFELRADSEDGTVEGFAVPYGQVANIGGKFQEQFIRGAFDGSEDIKLYYGTRKS